MYRKKVCYKIILVYLINNRRKRGKRYSNFLIPSIFEIFSILQFDEMSSIFFTVPDSRKSFPFKSPLTLTASRVIRKIVILSIDSNLILVKSGRNF